MEIVKYENNGKLTEFGDYAEFVTEQARWYIGENKIGVTAHFLQGPQGFLEDFLQTGDHIIIGEDWIQRGKDTASRLTGERVSDLREFLLSNDTTYAFRSTVRGEKALFPVLTFSPEKPPENYKKRITSQVIESESSKIPDYI